MTFFMINFLNRLIKCLKTKAYLLVMVFSYKIFVVMKKFKSKVLTIFL